MNGARRIKLEEQGNKHDVKTIAESMRRQNLVAETARKFKVTTDSKHDLRLGPKYLSKNFLLLSLIKSGLVISST